MRRRNSESIFILTILLIVEIMSKKMDNQPDEKVTQWAELMGELFDRLTGKGAEITYNFENLEIDIPKAVGPGGQNMGSAKWTINGRLVITAEAHGAEHMDQKPTISSQAK
jgi:hypothetical protein